MDKKELLIRIAAGIAFFALAFWSCSWTANSLYIWQKDLTMVGAWIIAVCLYAFVSVFFSILLKCFDKRPKFMFFDSKNSAGIVSGIIMLVVWVWFGLATNTHNFIYKAEIKEVITSDLKICKKYLECMNQNTCNPKIKAIEDEKDTLKRKVQDILLRLKTEIRRTNALGIGPVFKSAYSELKTVLMANFQTSVDNVGKTMKEWDAKYEEIRKEALGFLKIREDEFDAKIAGIRKEIDSEEIASLTSKLDKALDTLKKSGYDIETVQSIEDDLNGAFSHIRTHSDYVTFEGNDRIYFTRDGAILRSNELKNPSAIWWDYLFTDKYNGHGFESKIMLSIVVDLMAFVFCFIAFNYKRKDV